MTMLPKLVSTTISCSIPVKGGANIITLTPESNFRPNFLRASSETQPRQAPSAKRHAPHVQGADITSTEAQQQRGGGLSFTGWRREFSQGVHYSLSKRVILEGRGRGGGEKRRWGNLWVPGACGKRTEEGKGGGWNFRACSSKLLCMSPFVTCDSSTVCTIVHWSL